MSDFSPAQIESFHYVGYDFNPANGIVRFRYALDDFHFVEQFTFPTQQPKDEAAFNAVMKLLFLASGLSYFKAAAPRRVVINEPIAPETQTLLTQMFSLGLAEFAYKNDLGILQPELVAEQSTSEPASTSPLEHHAVIPVGGGKDSTVTIEAVRQLDVPVTLFAVRDFNAIKRTAAVADLPLVVVDRSIDPALLELNGHGAYNGHVPATAVISLAALLYAVQRGYSTVIMSNERSASAGNTFLDQVEVNHQWSKSLEFETLLREVLAKEVNPNLEYFSALRPFSELRIAQAFSKLTQYHQAFLSCNRAFVLEPKQRLDHWCGECAKCQFVFLILAPFLGADELQNIFGRDLFDSIEHLEGFEELTGLRAHKPFECVGEIPEAQAAVVAAAKQSDWHDEPIIQELMKQLTVDDALFQVLLEPSDEHFIPERWKGILDAVS